MNRVADSFSCLFCLGFGTVIFMTIETEQEADGRWIAEVPELPGVLCYAPSCREAVQRAQVLALRVMADRIEHGEAVPEMNAVFSIAA